MPEPDVPDVPPSFGFLSMTASSTGDDPSHPSVHTANAGGVPGVKAADPRSGDANDKGGLRMEPAFVIDHAPP
jgi:hypothetical protein